MRTFFGSLRRYVALYFVTSFKRVERLLKLHLYEFLFLTIMGDVRGLRKIEQPHCSALVAETGSDHLPPERFAHLLAICNATTSNYKQFAYKHLQCKQL